MNNLVLHLHPAQVPVRIYASRIRGGWADCRRC
jgi:hypothetical protein